MLKLKKQEENSIFPSSRKHFPLLDIQSSNNISFKDYKYNSCITIIYFEGLSL